LCKPQMEDSVEALLNRIDILEKKLESGVVVASGSQAQSAEGVSGAQSQVDSDGNNGGNSTQQGGPTPQDNLSPERRSELVKAMPEEIKELAKNWQMVINKTPIYIRESIKLATPYAAEDGTLILLFEDNFAYSSISREMHMTQIKNIIVSIINKEVNIRTQYSDKAEPVDNMVNIASLINADITYEN